jgi:hypothetical protein
MNKANVTSARRTRQARKTNIPRETLGSENRRLFLSANLGFLLRQLRRVREVRSSELSRLLPYCAGSVWLAIRGGRVDSDPPPRRGIG